MCLCCYSGANREKPECAQTSRQGISGFLGSLFQTCPRRAHARMTTDQEVNMKIEGSNLERRHCGNIDNAVEFINSRPHENFVIYDATDDVIREIKRRVKNIVEKG